MAQVGLRNAAVRAAQVHHYVANAQALVWVRVALGVLAWPLEVELSPNLVGRRRKVFWERLLGGRLALDLALVT